MEHIIFGNVVLACVFLRWIITWEMSKMTASHHALSPGTTQIRTATAAARGTCGASRRPRSLKKRKRSSRRGSPGVRPQLRFCGWRGCTSRPRGRDGGCGGGASEVSIRCPFLGPAVRTFKKFSNSILQTNCEHLSI